MWNVAKANMLKSADKKSAGGIADPAHLEEDIHDDDKSKKKGTSGTPEKIPSGVVVNEVKRSSVINDEVIQRLAIKDEDLENLRQSTQPAAASDKVEDNPKMFAVKKSKPQNELKVKYTEIVVARPAPLHAPLKSVDYSGPCGPRYTKTGEIVPHSVLGPVQNFVEEAVKRNDMRPDSPAVVEIQTHAKLPVTTYKRPKSTYRDYIPTAMNQENALLNWRRKMAERKRVQGHISELLQKPLDRLVMNQTDTYREVQETRGVIDRAIPVMDYGKGYRVGSEFWKQNENFGDDLTGIKMTLTKTEKGIPVVFEHIGKPAMSQQETNEALHGDRPTVDPRKNWLSSKYLKKRTRQLEPVISELDPYKPDLLRLEVVGNENHPHHPKETMVHDDDDEEDSPQPFENYLNVKNASQDPLSGYPDVIPEPHIGPSIVFNGMPAHWIGSSTENKGKIGWVARVTFEAKATERTSSHLKVKNDGTTAIYYEWRKLPKEPVFESLKQDPVQRFYFNTGEGVILPGDTKKVPFVFKSPNPGIFTEIWEFITRPAVMGGVSLQVVLKGIATQDDSANTEVRMKIVKKLERLEAEDTVQKLIYDIVKGIQKRERPPSPIDAYITEEEIFLRKNPGRYYNYETVRELKNIYQQLFAEENREGKEWDLSLEELQSCVTAVPDEEARDELLKGLNNIIGRLSFPPYSPQKQAMYALGYKLWLESIDKLVGCSVRIRTIMGLPELIMTETISEPELYDKKPKGKKNASKDAKDAKKGGKAVKETKEKERPKSKEKGKTPKTAPSPTKEQPGEREVTLKSPTNLRESPADSLDPVTRHKYTEKMYGQVYELLVEMVENMTMAFEETKST